jgi:hypothetical protein
MTWMREPAVKIARVSRNAFHIHIPRRKFPSMSLRSPLSIRTGRKLAPPEQAGPLDGHVDMGERHRGMPPPSFSLARPAALQNAILCGGSEAKLRTICARCPAPTPICSDCHLANARADYRIARSHAVSLAVSAP